MRIRERTPTTMTLTSYLCIFPGGSVVNNPLARQETQVQSLAQEDPLEKEMSTHCSIPAWGIPWRGAWQTIVHGVTTSPTLLSEQIANS